MEVEYSLTLEDMDAFGRHQLNNAPKLPQRIRPKVVFWILIIVVNAIVVACLSDERVAQMVVDGLLRFVLPFVVGVFAGGGAIMYWFVSSFDGSAKKLFEDKHSRWLFSTRRLSISPDAVRTVSENQEAIYRWPIIWRIDNNDEYAFFYTSFNAGFLVPRRAFRDQAHFEEFLALAQQYQQGQGQHVPKPTGIITGLPPQSDAFTHPDVP